MFFNAANTVVIYVEDKNLAGNSVPSANVQSCTALQVMKNDIALHLSENGLNITWKQYSLQLLCRKSSTFAS